MPDDGQGFFLGMSERLKQSVHPVGRVGNVFATGWRVFGRISEPVVRGWVGGDDVGKGPPGPRAEVDFAQSGDDLKRSVAFGGNEFASLPGAAGIAGADTPRSEVEQPVCYLSGLGFSGGGERDIWAGKAKIAVG